MKREILKKLEEWKEKVDKKPLILKGARQVGKTYCLKQFAIQAYNKHHYFNFEEEPGLSLIFEKNLTPSRIIHELSFHVQTQIEINEDLLIFDEIQHCSKAVTSLKYFNEKMPQLDICCAGSLLGLHFGESSFPVGKVEFLNMYPMSFFEFLTNIHQKMAVDVLLLRDEPRQYSELIHQKLWELLKYYFITGGLPEVVKVFRDAGENIYEGLTRARSVQKILINAYLADMAKHSGKQNAMHIDRMWRSVPAQLAGSHDGSAPKFKFKGVLPNISGYSRMAGVIDWLEKAGLIIKIPIANKANSPVSAFTTENSFKLYMFDVGMLCALSDFSLESILQYDYGTYKGYFAENFAIQSFLASYPNQFYCWKEGTAEVEFITDIKGEIIPIEIKSGWVTQAKSLSVFDKKYNPVKKIILSAKPISKNKNSNTFHYPLYLSGNLPDFT